MPDGWHQGRGAWGGLIVGALVRAVERTEPDASRQVRTVTAHIVAPALVGPHRIDVEPVRLGSAMSTWQAVLRTEDDEEVARLTAIAGGPRAFAATVPGPWGIAQAPPAPDAGAVARVPGGDPFPEFTRHLDMRPSTGLPLSGGPADSVGWVGYDRPATAGAPALLALVDGWWPASLALLPTVPRIATVSFTASLLVDPATVDLSGVLLHHSFVTAASDGYTSEHRRLWSPAGDLLVDNVQTIVVGS